MNEDKASPGGGNVNTDDQEPWDEEAGGGRTIAMSAPAFDSSVPSPITLPPPAEGAAEALKPAPLPAAAPASGPAGVQPAAVIKRASVPDEAKAGGLFARTEPAEFAPVASERRPGSAPASSERRPGSAPVSSKMAPPASSKMAPPVSGKMAPPRVAPSNAGPVKAPAPAAKAPAPRTAPYAFSPGPKVEGSVPSAPPHSKRPPAAAPAPVPSFGEEDAEDNPTMALDQASLAPVATQSADKIPAVRPAAGAVPAYAGEEGEKEDPTRVASEFMRPGADQVVVGHGADGEGSTLAAPPGGALASPGIAPGFAETLTDDRPTSIGSRAALTSKGNIEPLPGHTPGVFAWGRAPSGAIDPNISGEEFAPVPMSAQGYGAPQQPPPAYGTPGGYGAPQGYPPPAPMPHAHGIPGAFNQGPMPGSYPQAQGHPYPSMQGQAPWGQPPVAAPMMAPHGYPGWGAPPSAAPMVPTITPRSKTQTMILVGVIAFCLLMFVGGIVLFAIARL